MRHGLMAAGLAALGGGEPILAAAAPCEPVPAEAASVRDVGEDLSLVLRDGRRLRLLGIEPVAATPSRPAAAATARATLSTWLSGLEVRVQVTGQADRWNRTPALVSAAAAPGGAPTLAVSIALVDAGLARARPELLPAACWPALLQAEASARAAALGLWADPYYAVRSASDGPKLASLAGEWVVVEGRVAHVGQTRTATYLDLDVPRGGIALRLARSVSFTPGQAARGQDGWIGQRLRARGLLDDRHGPRLDIRDAAQIELLPEDGQAAARGEGADAGH